MALRFARPRRWRCGLGFFASEGVEEYVREEFVAGGSAVVGA